MKTGFEQLFQHINKVSNVRKYWLIRSMGGDFYDEYVQHGFITIGYNEIVLEEIKFAATKEDKAVDELETIADLKLIGKKEDEEYNTRYAATQLLRFFRDISIGDVVIVPGKSSDIMAIGYVTSDLFTENKIANLTGTCQFNKRRTVNFFKKTSRTRLNPEMRLMFNSRHIISNVDHYAEYIDNVISDFYQKDDKMYLVLKVKQTNDLSACDFTLIADLLSLLGEYSNENDLNIDQESIKMKLCVQSPGDILAFAQSYEGIAIIGMIILFLKRGTMSWNKENGLNFDVGGWSDDFAKMMYSISDFLDRRRDRIFKKGIQKKLENMEIEAPEDLNSILDELMKGRKEY